MFARFMKNDPVRKVATYKDHAIKGKLQSVSTTHTRNQPN